MEAAEKASLDRTMEMQNENLEIMKKSVSSANDNIDEHYKNVTDEDKGLAILSAFDVAFGQFMVQELGIDSKKSKEMRVALYQEAIEMAQRKRG